MAGIRYTNFPALGGYVAEDDKILLLDSSAGTLKLGEIADIVGGWRDMRSSIISGKPGLTNPPTPTAFGPSGDHIQYAFGVDDDVEVIPFHVDHDVKVGSTFYIHIHWSTDGTSTNSVKWQLKLSWAERDDTTHDTFTTSTTITLEDTPDGSAWEHIVTEDATGFLAKPIDSLIMCHLTRITNGGSENNDDVFGIYVDIHYEAQQYGTPSRAPDFYT